MSLKSHWYPAPRPGILDNHLLDLCPMPHIAQHDDRNLLRHGSGKAFRLIQGALLTPSQFAAPYLRPS